MSKKGNFTNAKVHFEKNTNMYTYIGENEGITAHMCRFNVTEKEFSQAMKQDYRLKISRIVYFFEDNVVGYIETFIHPKSGVDSHEFAPHHKRPVVEYFNQPLVEVVSQIQYTIEGEQNEETEEEK